MKGSSHFKVMNGKQMMQLYKVCGYIICENKQYEKREYEI